MADDWIKYRKALPDEPEVISIACRLGIEVEAVVGRLMRLWSWADSVTISGHVPGVTPKAIDHMVRADNFAAALESVGWLLVDSDGIRLPNYRRHNTKPSKQRALASRRQSRKRRDVMRDTSVTKSAPTEEKEKEPPTVPLGFDLFWQTYPNRGGRKRGRAKCVKLFADVPELDRPALARAVANYAASEDAKRGYARDPERFLAAGW